MVPYEFSSKIPIAVFIMSPLWTDALYRTASNRQSQAQQCISCITQLCSLLEDVEGLCPFRHFGKELYFDLFNLSIAAAANHPKVTDSPYTLYLMMGRIRSDAP